MYSRSPEYNRAWRKKRKEELGDFWTEHNSRWRLRHPKRYLMHKAKGRAKKLNLEFNLTEEDINIPEICPVLGIPLEVKLGHKDNAPSLDRIDNSLGYTKDNIKVVSWRANDLKKNGTLEEFRRLVRWLENGEEKKLS